MTIEIMWSLLIALGAIAVGAVLHAVDTSRQLHLANEENSGFRKQLDSLKEQHEKSISDLKMPYDADKEKLLQRIALLENEINSQDGGPYEPQQFPDS